MLFKSDFWVKNTKIELDFKCFLSKLTPWKNHVNFLSFPIGPQITLVFSDPNSSHHRCICFFPPC